MATLGVRPTPRVAIACPQRSISDTPVWERGLINTVKGFDIATQTLTPMGMSVDQAYTDIVRTCLANGVDYLVILESDMIVPRNVLSQLLHRAHDEKLPFVCGSYVLKDTTGQSAAITVDENGTPINFPNPFEERGVVPCGWVVPFGCSIIRTEVFADIPFPWFQTVFGSPDRPVPMSFQGQQVEITNTLTQDAFFCERLFASGYQGYVDTDIQCLHMDRESGRIFGSPRYVDEYALRSSEAWRFAVSERSLANIHLAKT